MFLSINPEDNLPVDPNTFTVETEEPSNLPVSTVQMYLVCNTCFGTFSSIEWALEAHAEAAAHVDEEGFYQCEDADGSPEYRILPENEAF